MIKAYISTIIKGEALIKDMKYHLFLENKADMTMSEINTNISKLLQSEIGLYILLTYCYIAFITL